MAIINSGDIHTSVAPGIDEMVFKVDDEDQGFIFEMLRSKIYSDPIAAICREIASNSRDANREVLKGHIPIKIGFAEDHPMNGDSSLHIYFKDEGPGISIERMANVFCKYAKSTKREDNVQTGGFGLGAKTPFAYVDAFTIITIVDGIKYTYTAYIDESRRGKIAKLAQCETAEPNGTTIQIPITSNDRYKFERDAIKFTSLWEVRPVYENFKHYTNNDFPDMYADTENTFKLDDKHNMHFINDGDQYFRGTHGIVVDGIPYELDMNQIAMFKGLGHASSIHGTHIVLMVNTGDVDLSVNRESLHYTENTIALLTELFELIAYEMSILINDFVTCSKSYFEACVRAFSVLNGRHVKDVNGNSLSGHAQVAMSWLKNYKRDDIIKLFDYNGKSVNIHNVAMNHMRFQVGYHNDNGNVGYRDVNFNLTFFYDRPIYILDTKTKSIARTEHVIKSNPSHEIILMSYREYVPSKGLSAEGIAENHKKFAEALAEEKKTFESYEIPTQTYSNIPLPVRAKSERGKLSDIISIPVRRITWSSRWNSKDNADPITLSVRRLSGPVANDGTTNKFGDYVYIACSDMKAMPELNADVISQAMFLSEYYGKTTVFVPNRFVHHFSKCEDLATASAKITVDILQKVRNALEIIYVHKKVYEFGMYDIVVNDVKMQAELKRIKRAAILYNQRRFIRKMLDNSSRLDVLFDNYKIKPNADLSVIDDFLKNFYVRYPLLKMLGNLQFVNGKNHVNNYICLVDAALAQAIESEESITV